MINTEISICIPSNPTADAMGVRTGKEAKELALALQTIGVAYARRRLPLAIVRRRMELRGEGDE